MLPSEVLRRAHDARLRIAQIDAEVTAMRDRCTVGGYHGSEIACSTILDPTRHIDALMDALGDYDRERLSLLEDVDEGRRLCEGIHAVMDSTKADILSMWYVDAREVGEIVRATTCPRSYIYCVIHDAPAWIDDLGTAKLLHLAKKRGRQHCPEGVFSIKTT